MRRHLLFVACLAAAALGGAAVVQAVPGPNGLITACYTPGQTNVRLVDDAATCAQFQSSAVSWNPQGGPAGPQGAAGPPGPQGPEGPAGPAGDIPDATANKLLAQIGADRRTLVKLRAQIRQIDNSPGAARAAQLQAQMDRMTKALDTLSRLMQKAHETSQTVISNIK